MKNNFLYLALIVLLYGSACVPDDQDEIIEPEYILEINVDAGYIFNDGSDVVAWLTDDSGKILVDTVLNNGDKIMIEKPKDFNGERFSLHILNYYSSSDNFELKTYSNILGGKINLKKLNYDNGNTTGNVEISFTDVPYYKNCYISGGFIGSYITATNTIPTYNYPVYENTDWFYLCLKNDDEAYYQIIDNIKSTNQMSVSLQDMNTNLSKYVLSFDKGENPFVILHGFEEQNDYYSKITPLWIEFLHTTGAIQTNLFVPEAEEKFEDFVVELAVQEENADNINYQYYSYGTIPSSMKYINAQLDKSSLRSDNIKINATGDFDIFNIEFKNLDNGYKSWTFYGSSSNDINFPELPERIKHECPQINKEQLFAENVAYSISIDNQDNCNGYDEAIGRILLRGELRELDGITEKLSLFSAGRLD